MGDRHHASARPTGGRAPRRAPARSRRRPRWWPRRAPAARGRPAGRGPGPRAGARPPTGCRPARPPGWRGRAAGRPATSRGPAPSNAARTSSSVAGAPAPSPPPSPWPWPRPSVGMPAAPSRPIRTFSAMVASNRNPSWGTSRTARRRASGATSRRSTPAEADLPGRRVGQAAQQLGERGLARPGLAHDRHRPPGRQADLDVAQHRHAVAVGEGEVGGDRPPAAPAGSARPSSGSGTSSGVASTPSTLRQPASAVWVWSRISDSSAIGHEQQVDQEHERDDHAHVEAPARPPGHAGGDGARHGEGAEDVAEREHRREVAGRRQVRPELAVDRRPQPRPGPALEPVGLDQRRAGDRLGHLGQRVAHRGAHPVLGGELAALQHRHQHDERAGRRPGRRGRAASRRPP